MEFAHIGLALRISAALAVGLSTAVHGVELLGCETGKITAFDADLLDGFGEHLAISENLLIVGAWNDEDAVSPPGGGFAFGSAYTLRQSGGTWIHEQKLMPTDSESEKRFGHDVAASGSTVLIGAPGASAYAGAAYFYSFIDGVWQDEQKVQPASGQATDEFGFAVAIDGDVAIIGSVGDDEGCGPGCNSGAAYIYRNIKGTWVEEQKLIATDAGFQERFGIAVDVYGTTAFVSSRIDSDAGVSTGSVWVYEYDGAIWQETQKFQAADAEVGDLFGHALMLGDGVAVVGSLQDDDACPGDPLCNSGSAYVFRYDGIRWNQESKLVAPNGMPDDEFGNAVAIEGDIIVVGTRFADDACPGEDPCESGVAYVYENSGSSWDYKEKLRASDTAFLDFFGADVAIASDRALVSCHLDDDDGPASGSVYIYDLSGAFCDCPADLDQSGAVDFNDLLAVLAAWGTAGGPADIDGDGQVAFGDLVTLLSSWGPCV